MDPNQQYQQPPTPDQQSAPPGPQFPSDIPLPQDTPLPPAQSPDTYADTPAPQPGYPSQQINQPQAPLPQNQQYGAPSPQQQAPQQPGMPQPPAQQRQEEIQQLASSNPNSSQNTLEIAEIRDGLVIMADGSYRAIVMAQSINFDLMSPQERESVEYSYQGFLNSLYFDIQIFIRSQKVDLRPYIQKLEKLHNEQDNMLLAYLMEDYINYIQLLARETNIMDKQFYIVIPYVPEVNTQAAVKKGKGLFNRVAGSSKGVVTINEADLETAKSQLKNRVQSVLGGLLQMGVQGVPLDTQELIELYYDVYNPDTSTHQRGLSKADFNVPVVTKGVGDASQPHLDRERG